MSSDRILEIGGSLPNAPPVALARARFGFGMPASSISVAIKKSSKGRVLFSIEAGGARLHIMNGISREVAMEPSGWRTAEVIERV